MYEDDDDVYEDGEDNEIDWSMYDIQGSTAYSMERDRPYDGQDYTDNGIRGKTLVEGLTMRDVADCIVKGFLEAGGVVRDCPIWEDLYEMDMDSVDPLEGIQNGMCNIEKMMGIFPNISDERD